MRNTKFCKKCNCETERSASGKCRPCDKARSAVFRAANPGIVKARAAAYRAANSEKCNATSAAWRAANPDRQKSLQAEWYVANTDRAKASMAAWSAANRDRDKANHAAWYAANKDSASARRHTRRARIRGVGGKLSLDLSAKLFKLQRGKCACCHVSIADGHHMDHVIPLALDGPNEDWNMQLLCGPCNLSKGAKHPVDFMQQRGFLC